MHWISFSAYLYDDLFLNVCKDFVVVSICIISVNAYVQDVING